jgi:hypothetical protein
MDPLASLPPPPFLSTSSSISPLHEIGAGSVGLLYASKIHRACADKYDKDTFQRELSRIRSLLLCTKANGACDGLTSIWDRLCSSLADSQPRIIILSNGAHVEII